MEHTALLSQRSRLTQAMDFMEARLQALPSLPEWGETPFVLQTLRHNLNGNLEAGAKPDWLSGIEVKTQTNGGSYVILLQAVGDIKVAEPDASGPILTTEFQVDLYHRPMMATGLIEPRLAAECIMRWLHEFRPIANHHGTRRLRLTGGESGLTAADKFFVTKLKFSWECVLATAPGLVS